MISVLAARYASALVDATTSAAFTGDPHRALEELKLVEAELAAAADLRTAMGSPAVAASKKRAILAKIAQQLGLSRYVTNFLFVMASKKRLGQLSQIREAYEELLDARLGFARASVSSARELNAEEKARLEAQLARLTGKGIKAHYSVDSALVGGVLARVGSTVYDGSIRGQLESLRRKLTS